MKRDIDLARQLLLDIENRGADCSVSVLRTGPNHQAEEQVRYHLRLLIDAGLLKEIDQTSAGVPCVRLTHDGHEMVELARSDARWREAKWACHSRTGGLSLTVIRTLLVKWALGSYRYASSRRVDAGTPVRRYRDRTYARPTYRVDPYRFEDRGWWFEDDGEYAPHPVDFSNRWRRSGYDLDGDGYVDAEFEPAIPDELI